jgi:hypothetical protein
MMSILPFVFRRWRWLTAIALVTAITSAVAAIQPWPLKVLLDYGIDNLSPPSIVRVPSDAVGLSSSAVNGCSARRIMREFMGVTTRLDSKALVSP